MRSFFYGLFLNLEAVRYKSDPGITSVGRRPKPFEKNEGGDNHTNYFVDNKYLSEPFN